MGLSNEEFPLVPLGAAFLEMVNREGTGETRLCAQPARPAAAGTETDESLRKLHAGFSSLNREETAKQGFLTPQTAEA